MWVSIELVRVTQHFSTDPLSVCLPPSPFNMADYLMMVKCVTFDKGKLMIVFRHEWTNLGNSGKQFPDCDFSLMEEITARNFPSSCFVFLSTAFRSQTHTHTKKGRHVTHTHRGYPINKEQAVDNIHPLIKCRCFLLWEKVKRRPPPLRTKPPSGCFC